MSPAERNVPPPQDVLRALARMAAAFVGLLLLSLGLWWLLDGGSARWPAYLGWAALAVTPAGLLLAVWLRLHVAAGRRVVERSGWEGRDSPHYGWRIEAAIVGALLSLVAVASAIGVVVLAVEAYDRSSWTEVEARYVQLEAGDPGLCDGDDCPGRHRLVAEDEVAVLVDAPAMSWPSDDELPGTFVTVYFDGGDPETATAEASEELAARAIAILAVGLVVSAGAWTILAVAGEGPQRP